MHKYILGLLVLLVGFAGGIVYERGVTPVEKRIEGVEEVVSSHSAQADFSPFWKAWEIIDKRFVDTSEEKVGKQERVWGAIAGLARSLGDPHTMFLPPQETRVFTEDVSGFFGGAGMEIDVINGLLTVVAPLRGTPAEKAGIQAGDVIAAIDDEPSLEMSVHEAVNRIRGEVGTKVTLTLLRESEAQPIIAELVRERINIPTLETRREEDVFVIELYNFGETSPELFELALTEFAESGSTKLILDVRGNPGGFLDAAIDIASWFVPQGLPIVYEAYGGAMPREVAYRSKGYHLDMSAVEVVVLVNRGSASASEIVAGALQEHDIATIVGTETFGKGSVQELISITPETALKLTISEWQTPKRKSISDGGLTPDVEVGLTLEDIEKGEDPQFEKAIEILKQQ